MVGVHVSNTWRKEGMPRGACSLYGDGVSARSYTKRMGVEKIYKKKEKILNVVFFLIALLCFSISYQ